MQSHPGYLGQRGVAALGQFQCCLAQAARAVAPCRFLDKPDRALVHDQLADFISQNQYFGYRTSAFVTGTATISAAFALLKKVTGNLARCQMRT